MSAPYRRFGLTVLASLWLNSAQAASPAPASAPQPAAAGDVIAQAGSIELKSADVRALVASLPATERAAATTNPSALEQLVRSELARRSILSEAKATGFDRQPDTIAAFDRVHDEILVRLWLANKSSAPAAFPSDAELNTAYENNKASLAAPTEYHLAQIFISAPDDASPDKYAAAMRKAADIAAKLTSANFGQLAQQQSEHAESAPKGGDMGFVAENRLAPEIDAAVKNLKPGEVVGPVKSAQGLRFFKLIETKPGAVPSLAEVHDRLVAALRERLANELQQRYLADLNGRLGVSVNEIELAKLQATLH
jgi:peptidylprolyl isomerase